MLGLGFIGEDLKEIWRDLDFEEEEEGLRKEGFRRMEMETLGKGLRTMESMRGVCLKLHLIGLEFGGSVRGEWVGTRRPEIIRLHSLVI